MIQTWRFDFDANFFITADRAGLQQKDVLEVLELTSLSSPYLIEKGKGKVSFLFEFRIPQKVSFEA